MAERLELTLRIHLEDEIVRQLAIEPGIADDHRAPAEHPLDGRCGAALQYGPAKTANHVGCLDLLPQGLVGDFAGDHEAVERQGTCHDLEPVAFLIRDRPYHVIAAAFAEQVGTGDGRNDALDSLVLVDQAHRQEGDVTPRMSLRQRGVIRQAVVGERRHQYGSAATTPHPFGIEAGMRHRTVGRPANPLGQREMLARVAFPADNLALRAKRDSRSVAVDVVEDSVAERTRARGLSPTQEEIHQKVIVKDDDAGKPLKQLDCARMKGIVIADVVDDGVERPPEIGRAPHIVPAHRFEARERLRAVEYFGDLRAHDRDRVAGPGETVAHAPAETSDSRLRTVRSDPRDLHARSCSIVAGHVVFMLPQRARPALPIWFVFARSFASRSRATPRLCASGGTSSPVSASWTMSESPPESSAVSSAFAAENASIVT